MTKDYRSERSESNEGKGIARKAWDSYAATMTKHVSPIISPVLDPVIEPAAKAMARDWIGDLMGFWMLWHLYGGFEGLERLGFHRATIFRKVKRFRSVFGAHPDEFEFPGITLDPAVYWAAPGKKIGPQPQS